MIIPMDPATTLKRHYQKRLETFQVDKRRAWTPEQEERLEILIREMMAEWGYVDLSILAQHCRHSMTSCLWKARNKRITFIEKTVKPYNYSVPQIKAIKGNMRALPLHEDGREVDYTV